MLALLYSFIFSPPVTFGDSPLIRGGLWCGANPLGKCGRRCGRPSASRLFSLLFLQQLLLLELEGIQMVIVSPFLQQLLVVALFQDLTMV